MSEKRVYLLPGELCALNEPGIISTLLGSCVAVCLFDRRRRIGGMNHYMLPETPPGERSSAKYGDYAVQSLIRMMNAYGSASGDLDATVIGGGEVTGHLGLGVHLGARNVVAARMLLEAAGIRIVRTHTGGQRGRKVAFTLPNGEATISRIEQSHHRHQIEVKKRDLAARRIKVLIVDDSPTVRGVITEALAGEDDIDVVAGAADPYEARQFLLEHDPDVICLDIIMPRMDGITFLKKLFLYKPKPVIVISTVVQEGSDLREQAQRIGAVDVIDKEDLDLYRNPERVRSVLGVKIRAAARVYVRPKTRQELDTI